MVAVYCPLSPRDPEHRLHMHLLQQTHCRLVLVHSSNENRNSMMTLFHLILIHLLINKYITNHTEDDPATIKCHKNIADNVAYIIFTSGSTGIPKAVCFQIALFDHISRLSAFDFSFKVQLKHRKLHKLQSIH